jgi:hypothetical protein
MWRVLIHGSPSCGLITEACAHSVMCCVITLILNQIREVKRAAAWLDSSHIAYIKEVEVFISVSALT